MFEDFAAGFTIRMISAAERDKQAVRRSGMRAYVAKTKAGEALVRAVEAAVQGEDSIAVN